MYHIPSAVKPTSIAHRLRATVAYLRQHPILAFGLLCLVFALGAGVHGWLRILRNSYIIQSVERAGGNVTVNPRPALGLERIIGPYYQHCYGDIKTVDLFNVPLSSFVISELARLDTATSIYLANTGLDDSQLKTLGRMTQLDNLGFGSASITETGFQHISRSRSINTLGLAYCDVPPAGWAHLNNMPQLRQLIVHEVPDFDIAELQAMQPTLHRLRSLRFYDIDLTDEDLIPIDTASQLEELSFFKCKFITGEGVKPFAKFQNLKRLILNGTQVTKEEIAELQRQLPDCVITGPDGNH